MGNINRIPLGYLDMLGSQTGGKNPFESADVVAPVVDMNAFYHAYGMETDDHTAVPAAIGAASHTWSVPNDEAWLLFGCGWRTTTTAANQRAQFLFATNNIGNQGNSGSSPIWTSEVEGDSFTNIGDWIGDSHWFDRPIPLLPGNTVQTFLMHADAAVTSTTWSLIYAAFSA